MDGDVVEGKSEVLLEDENDPIDKKSETITVLKAELQKEKDLRNELEMCNGQLRTKIAELQKEITNLKNDKKTAADVGTQTEEEIPVVNGEPDNAVPEKVEATSIADSIRDAAEVAMTNSGFVYDQTSGLYYDYTSGYYYNPENHLYYDTNTGRYYYYNDNTNSYEFHSQVAIPHQTQTQQETEERVYPRRKKDRSNRRKDNKEKYRNSRELVDSKTERRTRKERRYNNDREDRHDKRHHSIKHRERERKWTKVLSERIKEEKRHKRKKYKYAHSRSDKDSRRKLHHKKKRKKEKKDCCKNDDGKDLKIVQNVGSEEDIADTKDDLLKSEETEDNDVCEIIGDSSSKKKDIDIVVISSEESDIEEGEIDEMALKVKEEITDVKKEVVDVEEGEISTSPSSQNSSGRSSLSDISSNTTTDVSDEEMDEGNEDVEEKMEEDLPQVNPREYPPCIRMIVTKSESIQPGSLHIITCMGGSIGREGSEHTVLIPEIGISKKHAEIFYCQQSWQYYIKDLGSQNGTLINSKSLGEPRTESEAHILSHKDYLTIGGTVLRLHIHPGAETCDECEPGQVQALLAQTQTKAPVTATPDKEVQRRKGLKLIKKKYGLTKDNYIEKNLSTANPLYSDRAENRRKTVGSDNPYQKDDLPSSVDREIGSDNLGRKMMEKMGWKSGETLGKDNTGIKEPINVLSNNKRAGLGGQAQRTINNLTEGKLASEKWDMARARYDAITKPETKPVIIKGQLKKVEMMWTSGGVMKPQCKIKIKKENIFGSDDDEEEEGGVS